jgi:hypothetical protein
VSLDRGNRALTQPCVERVLLFRALVADLRASGLSVTTGTVNHAAILASLCHSAWMRSQATPHTSGLSTQWADGILKTPPLAA